uniref:Uncharacterized protein n=1 Tax=Cajanus cajan TaxID=3821 RepID=A0A151RB00_CAJCA|nr:hypothetical protein KK1_039028 [Cajanus cajan]
MGWFYPKKKSSEWKQGYKLAEQSMDTASLSPTLHLLVILGIVLSLLWLSHYITYKAQQNHTVIYFQLFLFFSPILFILFLLSYSYCGRLNFCFMLSGHKSLQRAVVSPLKLECTHLVATTATAIIFLLIFILF